MITVNKEILLHPDFYEGFEKDICDMLEALMDAELEKEDADFDFIDECADVINAVRFGDFNSVLPVISRRDFINKVSSASGGKFKKIAAVCAAVAMVIGINAYVEKTVNYNIIGEITSYLSGLLNNEPSTVPAETTTAPETTTEAVTTALPQVITKLEIETDERFKTEYTVGESFDKTGLAVYAVYNNRNSHKLGENEYEIIVSPDFAENEGYETVTVRYAGFEKRIEVRILVGKETPKLTSIYALFPEDFDFTTSDIDNINLDTMQVYAVYSDGSETELTADEYTLDIEIEKNLIKEEAFVTISYEGCSCSFMVFKE